MKKELNEMIDKAINLHMRAVINYEKMKMVVNRGTAFMDTQQKKAHKKELQEIMKMIKELE